MVNYGNENVVNVLAYVGINPHVSIRKVAQELGLSKSNVQRILKQHKYHPFKMHLVQGLRPADYDRRLEFLALLQIMIHDNAALLEQICWSDESRFHNNGVINKHNAHYWSTENPHWVQDTRFQSVWSINVWCALFNGRLIGPFFYEETLTAQRYLDFLVNVLPNLFEDLPLAERLTMIWQQDGAPAHNAQIVTRHLNNVFPNRWIGTRGPIQWPARSPDLTPLDFFLWGYLKELVYQTRSDNIKDLKKKIGRACQTVTPNMIRAACTRELLRRSESCVAAEGAQFENLL